ncbi:hypothetical protein QFZ41_003171 [Luteibacter sp. W1I16]|uniref:XVIPCD domain-containing protein n=1 Tax=Luteibacter sp. W1I16 TaxID=3373922 RepID=UPI003D1AA643
MTLRPLDYALIAKDSYVTERQTSEVELGGISYTIIDRAEDTASGFQAVAYRKIGTPDIVIAYRGTEIDREPIRDGLVDVGMVLGGFNAQQADAERFTRRILERAKEDSIGRRLPYEVTVTGHSLGGTLAEINGARFGLHGQTFNAYGAAGLYRDVPEGGHSVINHVRAGDPVSAASRHFGEVRVYANAKDVEAFTKSGYTSEHFDIFRTVKALDPGAHGVENFAPPGDRPVTSIISPEGEKLYRDNRDIIDRYRADVFEIRKHASVIWETRDMVIDGMLAAGHTAADQAKHGAQLIGTGARHAASDAVDVMRAAGLVAEPAATTLWGSKYGSSELEKMVNPPQLNDAAHPDHLLFEQARQAVYQLDTKHGRAPDTLSENLAASLTVAARREGMSRIDHVALSEDAQRAYAVQGELNSPFKKVADISTEIGISTSVKENTSALHDLTVRQPSVQEVPSQALSLQQQNHTPAGPAMSR